MIVTGTTISGNSAGVFGGGISVYFETVIVTSSTISGNSAKDSGGGIFSYGGVTATNSIIALNEAPSGPECRLVAWHSAAVSI